MRFRALNETASSTTATGKGKKRTPGADDAATPVAKAAQNLLVHIPGEASGFYLFAVDFLRSSPTEAIPAREALWVGGMALVLLVVVRWLANASLAILATTVVAFLIWMAVLDIGFLTLNGFGLGKLGPAVAFFYSTLVTLLATAGKLK
jgi:hypothetical protein